MIARIWHGRVPASKKKAYTEYLNKTGVPDYKATPGNRGIRVLCRTEGDIAHFMLISFWESYDVIEAFAGDEIKKARYYPEDGEYLLEFEPEVIHYKVLE